MILILLSLKFGKKLKPNLFWSPWIAKCIQKSSKREWRTFRRSYTAKISFWNERMPQKPLGDIYCKNQLFKWENAIKATSSIIKEVIGKRKVRSPFPDKIMVNNTKITNSLPIAKQFNNFFMILALNWLWDFLSQIIII